MKKIKGIIKKCKIKNNLHEKTDIYKFGFSKFGPLLYGYTVWLMLKIKENDIKKVYFFSRDGFMMKRAFDSINADKTVETKYVYFSRKSLRQALFWNSKDFEKSLEYLSSSRYISVNGILEYYGFEDKEINVLAHSLNLDLKQLYLTKELKYNKQIENIYYILFDEIYEKSRNQYLLLKKYLRQIEMNGKCAIVDIGWNGSMQFYLESIFDIEKEACDLKGFYLGINNLYPIKGHTYGYLYDGAKDRNRKKVLCALGVFEKLFQSLEGSSIGYYVVNNEVLPQKKQFEYLDNLECTIKIKEWQKGAMDFIEICNNIYVNEFDDLSDWAKPILRFGQFPSIKDVRVFNDFYIEDDGKQYYVSNKFFWEYKLKEFVQDLNRSPWKTGFMKSVFIIPFPYSLIYRMLKK